VSLPVNVVCCCAAHPSQPSCRIPAIYCREMNGSVYMHACMFTYVCMHVHATPGHGRPSRGGVTQIQACCQCCYMIYMCAHNNFFYMIYMHAHNNVFNMIYMYAHNNSFSYLCDSGMMVMLLHDTYVCTQHNNIYMHARGIL
jgi:hypothetical protein